MITIKQAHKECTDTLARHDASLSNGQIDSTEHARRVAATQAYYASQITDTRQLREGAARTKARKAAAKIERETLRAAFRNGDARILTPTCV